MQGNFYKSDDFLENVFVAALMIRNIFYEFLQNACYFYFLTTHTKETNKQTHTGTYNTQQMHLFVHYWMIMNLDTNILNALPSTSSDTVFKLTLKWELDVTICVQILEVFSHFQHNSVHS